MAEIHQVFLVSDIGGDALMIDADFTGVSGNRQRVNFPYRPSDEFGSAPMFRQWLADNNPEILPYNPPREPTPEELRAQMADKTPREFRDILIDEGILTDAVPDEVTVKINEIPFDMERMKALNAWHNMNAAQRSDPYIDMIGALFGKSQENIDSLWRAEKMN